MTAKKPVIDFQSLVEDSAQGSSCFAELHSAYQVIASGLKSLYEKTVKNQVSAEKKLMSHKIDLFNLEAKLADSEQAYETCLNNSSGSLLYQAFTNFKGKVLQARQNSHLVKQDFYAGRVIEAQQKAASLNDVGDFLKYALKEFEELYFVICETDKNLAIASAAFNVFNGTELEEGIEKGTARSVFSLFVACRDWIEAVAARVPSYDFRDRDFRHINSLIEDVQQACREYDQQLEQKARGFFEDDSD
ncbi:hypothetical protein KY338_01975 [Candidatus Woesearchaeota archaeon]|nr:hypothetical protein [Candidatus Woesearchaeota archaeon]MBW3005955.1 hypothetical protein [Candidatus Woesearchaeota archaeon]